MASSRGTAKPRVLLVTRHFWPHAAGRHDSAAEAWRLATRWSAADWSVEVVTVRYGVDWPPEFSLGNIRVHRIAAAPRGGWAESRYVRYLGQWLVENASSYDAIVCHGLREDVQALACVPHQRNSSPVQRVVIAGGYGSDGDLFWCRRHRTGKRAAQIATSIDAVVTNGPTLDRFLISSDVPPHSLHRIHRGMERRPVVTPGQKTHARRVLGEINSDLKTNPDDVVLLWCGLMNESIQHGSTSDASMDLVSLALKALQRFPRLRIWLLGDGPRRDWLHDELRAEGIRGSVAIPGSFPDMTEVWNSADFFVQTQDSQLRETVWAAMERGLPLVLAQSTAVLESISSDTLGSLVDSVSWYDATQPSSLHSAIGDVIDGMAVAKQKSISLANHLSQSQPCAEVLDHWRSILIP